MSRLEITAIRDNEVLPSVQEDMCTRDLPYGLSCAKIYVYLNKSNLKIKQLNNLIPLVSFMSKTKFP